MIDTSNYYAYDVFLGDRIAGEIRMDRRECIDVVMRNGDSWYRPEMFPGTFSDAIEAIISRAAGHDPAWASQPMTLRETRRLEPPKPAEPGALRRAFIRWFSAKAA